MTVEHAINALHAAENAEARGTLDALEQAAELFLESAISWRKASMTIGSVYRGEALSCAEESARRAAHLLNHLAEHFGREAKNEIKRRLRVVPRGEG